MDLRASYSSARREIVTGVKLDDLSPLDRMNVLAELLNQTGLWEALKKQYGPGVDILWADKALSFTAVNP